MKTSKIKRALINAYNLIGTKRKWMRKAFAHDSNGDMVSVFSSKAVKWCAIGALIRAAGNNNTYKPAHALLSGACNVMYSRSITKVNDNLGYRQIRAAYRRAIREAS